MPAISNKTKKEINGLISEVVEKYLLKAVKSKNVNSGNPFVLAILKDFDPLLHCIHGLKTSMGGEMEKIAEKIAIDSWGKHNVFRKKELVVNLPKNVFQTIDEIMSNLTDVKKHPNYKEEKKTIIDAIKRNKKQFQKHKYEYDLHLKEPNRNQYYFLEMKGPDPNTTEVPGAKRRLLTLLAHGLIHFKTEKVDIALGVYYNNKFPKPFNNPKVLNCFDPSGDIKVHENFWNFIGRNNTTYTELLVLFENYGKKNKKKIWDGFSKLIELD